MRCPSLAFHSERPQCSLLPIASCVRDPFDVSREGNACTPDPFHEKVTRKNETANEGRFGRTRLQLRSVQRVKLMTRKRHDLATSGSFRRTKDKNDAKVTEQPIYHWYSVFVFAQARPLTVLQERLH